MKDAYSFHVDQASLAKTYRDMYDAYTRIFTRLGQIFVPYKQIPALSAALPRMSFMYWRTAAKTISPSLTPLITRRTLSLPNLYPLTWLRQPPKQAREDVLTEGMTSCKMVAEHLDIPLANTVKTLIVHGHKEDDTPQLIAIVLRGDHQLNTIKAEKIEEANVPLTLASDAELKAAGLHKGYIGVDLDMPVFVDRSAATLSDFVAGANVVNKHTIGMNWVRDTRITRIVDVRNVQEGDLLLMVKAR